ncbi:MAG: TonB-dependent receptor [Gammaproteobacteria bacterium]|nr:TonB-dependent receptor [Gammaproteobacteria bacterium]
MFEQKTPLALAILSVLYPATSALAQEHQAGRLEEVVVTATRREINLQSVSQSITAFSTEDIEKQAFQSLNDIVNAIPSVNMISWQPGSNAIVVRGVATSSAEFRTDSQVSVYLDDQPMTAISQQVGVRPIDLERVESLPGPQGTLFGSSSQTGTLVYITNKPDISGFGAQMDAEVSTTSGGEESYDVSGHVNIPVTDDLAVRVVGFYAGEGGYVDNVFGTTLVGGIDNAAVVEDDWNDYTVYGGRVAARWQVSPDWESTLSLIGQVGESEGGWESDPALGDYKITRFQDESYDDSWYQASLNVKGDLGFADLSVTGSYFDRDIKYDLDNANYDQWRTAHYGVYLGADLYNTDYLIGSFLNDQIQERYSAEVRLTSKGESRFQWMLGAFYEDVHDRWTVTSVIPGYQTTTSWAYAQYLAYYYNAQGYDIQYPLDPTEIYYIGTYDNKVKQTAVFGELSFDLTDNWTVTGGARWFEYERDVSETRASPFGFPIGRDFEGGGVVESQGKDSDTVLKFSTQYRFSDTKMIYALYSEGFRLGGNNDPRASAGGILPAEYKPDTVKNYEAGIKTRWLDQSLQLNLTAFFMEWQDIHLNRSGSTAGNPWWMRGTFNGGKAEQKGFEFSIGWYPTDNFSIDVSAFLADPEFSEDTFYPDGRLAIESGTTMPISPEEKYWVGASYTFPNFMGTQGDLWTRIAWSYQSEIWNSLSAISEFEEAATPAERRDALDRLIPSYTSTTLQLGFTHDNGWETSLVVRNLFDERGLNYLSSSDYSSGPNDVLPWTDDRFRYLRSLQRPRTIGLSFSKKW